MYSTEHYREAFLEFLNAEINVKEPRNLYEPIQYILQIGGKRLRPILTLIAADLFSGDYHKALNAAAAVEVFHNFSLIHDDIMDKAPLRRGKATVHQKWNLNIGILSGDAMLVKAYQLLDSYPAEIFTPLTQLLSRTALQVCEGQQWDMDFETETEVPIDTYLQMIRYKTAVLVGAALQMGAIVVGASRNDQELLYNFGEKIGLAFQLQDDYLDTFGDYTFGKRIGGDIIENKKTILYLKALALANTQQHQALKQYYTTTEDNEIKIASVKALFEATGAAQSVRKEIEKITDEALELLSKLTITEEKHQYLRDFAVGLMGRKV
ncbi:polyprenyl synthetase family protein [Capnocytophaga sp. oral taxon 878]|uniref:polyprenyl synthetase family protein n=1 Tax=Capnocytophaga sp. oral taxon 878 TaxID=1316596 RepID=UPI000D02C851|nr:polyprenyl synthetase family protein [Capnocytophaga sp. oral taxon 878]AVM49793.1 polyprenyl synthetase [Capnocytophaga sp. oral taxon 878]